MRLLVLLIAAFSLGARCDDRSGGADAARDAGGPEAGLEAGPDEGAGEKAATGEPGPPARRDGGVTAECRTDDDCALTELGEGSCCPSCELRAISRAEWERQARLCEVARTACPERMCPPPRRRLRAACEAGACVSRPEPPLN